MEWPIQKDGKFKTTPTAMDVWMAAMSPISTPRADAWRTRMEHVQQWRDEYMELVLEFCDIMLESSPSGAVAMAEAGLDALASIMVYRINENTIIPAKDAFERHDIQSLETQTIRSNKAHKNDYSYQLYSSKNQWVTGEKAKNQLLAWSDYGCIEESASHHASVVCSHNQVYTLVDNKVFVLLGLTSELGCAKPLLQIPGSHVMGVARHGKRLEGLVTWYHEHGAEQTLLQFPNDGADMLTQGPEIAKWIVETAPKRKEIVLCQLAYMDGEAHVRVSVAMDLICCYVCKNSSNKVSLSYLTSPATAHSIPSEAYTDAKRRLDNRPLWQTVTSTISMGQWLTTTDAWDKNGLFNGLAHFQGPNYALAKTMQQWRCMVAYWKHEIPVSCPHAPPARTESMVGYSTVAAGLEGMQMFEPNVSFSVESASSLMTAILLYQVNYDECLSNPKNQAKLEHPMHLFWDGSAHGGSWRCPYSSGGISVLSYLFGKTMVSGPYVPDSIVADE